MKGIEREYPKKEHLSSSFDDSNKNNKEEFVLSSVEKYVQEQFLSKDQFSERVEKLIFSLDGEITFIEAVLAIADHYGIDIQDIPRYISKRIKDKIEGEAIEENMLAYSKGANRLDSFFV